MDNEADHIRQQMRETRTSLTEKIETLEHQVLGTVEGARTAVSETVASVKDAVQETVDSVKDTLNIRRQVERHPWAMVAGAVAVGYVGGTLLRERPRTHIRERAIAPRLYRPEDPRAAAAPEERAGEPGWLGQLSEQFAPEIRKLKAAGIGAAVAFLRDLVTPSLPPSLQGRVREVMDSVASKVGGAPVPEPVIGSPNMPPNLQRRVS